MFCLILLNHIVACVWFLIGNREEGWVQSMDVGDREVVYQYLNAIHWTLTQFQGTSDIVPGTTLGERAYAVGTIVMALIVFSSFVSSLTNLMMQLQSLHSKRTYEQRVVRGYLAVHSISSVLSVRVKKYLEWKQRLDKSQEHDAE